MESVKILGELFDEKIISVLKTFVREKDKKFYLREISKITKVPAATTYRILNKLVKLELINQTRIKHLKLYQLSENDNTAFLENILKEGKRILQYFVDEIKNIPGVESIVLHGDETEEKANILIIGENINAEKIKPLCAKIKEEQNYTISTLALTKEQFEQISAMGLYSGTKKILFKK